MFLLLFFPSCEKKIILDHDFLKSILPYQKENLFCSSPFLSFPSFSFLLCMTSLLTSFCEVFFFYTIREKISFVISRFCLFSLSLTCSVKLHWAPHLLTSLTNVSLNVFIFLPGKKIRNIPCFRVFCTFRKKISFVLAHFPLSSISLSCSVWLPSGIYFFTFLNLSHSINWILSC